MPDSRRFQYRIGSWPVGWMITVSIPCDEFFSSLLGL